MTYVFVALAAYLAAVFTWPKIEVWANGAQSEAASLKAKADELLKKL